MEKNSSVLICSQGACVFFQLLKKKKKAFILVRLRLWPLTPVSLDGTLLWKELKYCSEGSAQQLTAQQMEDGGPYITSGYGAPMSMYL